MKHRGPSSHTAIVESMITHHNLIPRLAKLLFESKEKIVNNNAHCMNCIGVSVTAAANNDVNDNKSTSTTLTTNRSTVILGHPSLPLVDIVSNTEDRFISELPPFVTISSKD